MKKILASIAIGCSMIASAHAGGYGHGYHHHHRHNWAPIVVGALAAGAVYYMTQPQVQYYPPQPQYVQPMPQVYADATGNVFNQYGQLVCPGIPIYGQYGHIVGYNRGC